MKSSSLVLVLLAGCGGSSKIGGNCTYAATTGTCTITNVATAGSDGNTTYDFVADGQTAVSTQGDVDDLNGEPAGAECSAAAHFKKDETFACTIMKPTAGGCAPGVMLEGYDPGTLSACQ